MGHPPPSRDWREVRAEFPVLAALTYLNTGTYGPLPRCTLEAASRVLADELEHGRTGESYFETIGATRASVARRLAALVGASPGDMVLTNATTHGAQVVVGGLGLGPDDEIVSTDLEHHSFTTVLRASGARVKLASLKDTLDDDEMLTRLEARITPRTRLIALSQVSWIDGRVLPVGKLRTLGQPVLVDAAQSVGAIPVDVGSLDVDFVVFPCQKWLLGPDATGGAYVHPDWHGRLGIALPSYYGHEPFSGREVDVPLPDAERFSPGTIALAALAPLDAALAFAEALGVERFERARTLAAHFRKALADRFELAPTNGGSTLISLDPGRDAEEVAAALSGHGVVVRTVAPFRWIRVSVGFWNDTGDCERLLEALERAA